MKDIQKKKSVVVLALQSLGLVSGSEDFKRGYAALRSRMITLQKARKPVTIETLLSTPLKMKSQLKISSLSDLFEKESQLASQLAETRKEIVNVLTRSVREAGRRNIEIKEVIAGYGNAIALINERSNKK